MCMLNIHLLPLQSCIAKTAIFISAIFYDFDFILDLQRPSLHHIHHLGTFLRLCILPRVCTIVQPSNFFSSTASLCVHFCILYTAADTDDTSNLFPRNEEPSSDCRAWRMLHRYNSPTSAAHKPDTSTTIICNPFGDSDMGMEIFFGCCWKFMILIELLQSWGLFFETLQSWLAAQICLFKRCAEQWAMTERAMTEKTSPYASLKVAEHHIVDRPT